MVKYILDNINCDFLGYQNLINLYEECRVSFCEEIQISFIRWFSANLCAPLGAIFDKLNMDTLGEIKIKSIPKEIQSIIQRNDFLAHYGFPRLKDHKNTTIRFIKLQPDDGKYFNNYINEELINHPELPNLSYALKKQITELVYEIFVNAKIHSKTKFIYTCGQFFPNKHSILFTIADLGVGFKTNINQRFGKNLSAAKSIQWAVKNGNTTKNSISGGIGLAILQEFIHKNKGQMQIISGNGFYNFNFNEELIQEFKGEFPGTIITMEFKTDDKHSYCLSSEIKVEDIF
ncbi:MAG: hypothetical protein KBD37_04085 [Burkholderiales bacterium]|nr:hypothetical protein [Burkholderiales bacterium]